MKTKIAFLFLLCMVLTKRATAQLNKGDWMLGGGINFVSTQKLLTNEETTLMTLNPQLALMITDKWMLGAELDLILIDRQARVGQKIFFHHYFKDWKPTYLFWGLAVEWRKFKALTVAGGGRDTRTFQTDLKFGAHHFFNEHAALELLANYSFLQLLTIPSIDVRDVQNLGLELRASMRLFFPSKLSKDTLQEPINFRKGQWLIGGRLSITRGGNDFEPEAARFFSKRLALGFRLKYSDNASFRLFNFGQELFFRCYQNLGLKKKLYGELAAGYRFVMGRNNDKWMVGDRKVAWMLGLGLTNMLSKHASFDVVLFYEKDKPVFDTNPMKVTKNVGLKIALQAYIGGH